jgi:hypothetical protein
VHSNRTFRKRRPHLPGALLSSALLMTACAGEGPAPDPSGPTDAIPAAVADRPAVEFVYGELESYTTGTEEPLELRLGNFRSGTLDEIREAPVSELATLPEAGHLDGVRTSFSAPGAETTVVYRLGWKDGPRLPVDYFQGTTVADMLGLMELGDGVTGQYVSYDVDLTLADRTLSYRASWVQIDQEGDLRDLYPIDLVVGNGLIRKALRDAYATRPGMFEIHGTVDPDKVDRAAYGHAPCPDPLIGDANSGFETKNKGHTGWFDPIASWGHHWFEWSLQGKCTYSDIGWGCSASCSGTASSSSGDIGLADGEPYWCHYTNDDANYGTGTADPNSSVTCEGAAMGVVKNCTCLFGCSVQVRILPKGVGVVIDADPGYDSFGPKTDNITCSGIPHNE